MKNARKNRVMWGLVTTFIIILSAGYFLYHAYYLPSELRVAATNGDLRRVQQLLEAGTDVKKPLGPPSNSVLNRAVEGGNDQVVEAVLGAGADPNEPTETGMTPLMFAAFFGHSSIVENLVNHGAKLDAVDERHKNTALLIAIRKGNTDVVTKLLRAGADPNQGREWGDAPLCRAQALSKPQMVDVLMKGGAICP